MPKKTTKDTKKTDMTDVTAGKLLAATGAGRGVKAINELYNHATRKKPGEKGYQPANPNKSMGTKKKKKNRSTTFVYEYK